MLLFFLEYDQLVLTKFWTWRILSIEVLLKLYDDTGTLNRGWESGVKDSLSNWATSAPEFPYKREVGQ